MRVKGKDYELKSHKIGINGALYGFKVLDKEYIFVKKDDYLKSDINEKSNDKLLEGFVNLDSYKTYITDPKTSYETPYNLRFLLDSKNWFDFQFETAVVGDIFLNERLETRKGNTQTENYTAYYKRIKHEFRITTLDFNFFNPDLYPEENNNINSPSYSHIEVLDFSSSEANQPQRRFFNKNLANKISDIPGDANKEVLYVGMVKICWQISNIYKDVLQTLAITDLGNIMNIFSANPPTGTTIREYIETRPLPTIDKIIANLLLDWGYRDDANTAELYPIYDGDQFYGGYYISFNNYYNALANVYEGLAYINENNFFGINTDPSTWTPETLKDQNNKRLQYLINIIPQDSINFLDLDTKIKILKDFAVNRIYESREDAVVKITKSILPGQAVEFLYKLQNTEIVTDGIPKSLFELLYKKVNDSIAFFGKNNRREFINQLYKLWYVSNLNPYNALDLSLNNNNPATTNAYYSQFYKNKLITLDYDSHKSFGFFVDNMNFEFNSKLIAVFEEKIVGYHPNRAGEMVPDKDFVSIGDYDFYTAISLKEFKEGDTAVKFPAIALEGTPGNASYIIPLFYLKYMDDFGDNEDLWTTIGLTFDIALTFTGVGNISKLRHFRHLTKLGRLALGEALPASERILALEALSGAAALVELTSSVASIILQYYTSGCTIYIPVVESKINDNTPNGQIPNVPSSYTQEQKKKYEFCKNLDQFLFWTQIASVGTDFISSYMVRKSAKKMLDDGIPDDFLSLTDPVSGQSAYGIILRFADNLTEMKATFFHKIQNLIGTNTKLEQDFTNLLNDAEKYQFIVDFGKSDIKVLQELNSNYGSSLVQEWKAITYLKSQRISTTFLKNVRRVLSNEDFKMHLSEGEIIITGSATKPGSKIIGAHTRSVMQQFGGFIFKDLDRAEKVVRGHTRAYFFRYVNGVKKSLGKKTMFNFDWTDQRVWEEIAYALSHKKFKFSGTPNQYESVMSDGTGIIITIRNNKLETAYPNF